MKESIEINLEALKSTVATLIQLKFSHYGIDDLISKSVEVSDSLIQNIKSDFGSICDIDILPINDIKEHSCGGECICNPEIENNLIIHNSFDGREATESVVDNKL